MSGGFDFLVSSVEARYDYLSARSITREALKAAGLEEAGKYSDADLQKFADALSGIGGGQLDKVWGVLGASPSGTAAPAPKAEPKAEPKVETKPDDSKKDEAESKKDEADSKKDEADSKKDDSKKDDSKKDDGKKGGKKKK